LVNHSFHQLNEKNGWYDEGTDLPDKRKKKARKKIVQPLEKL